MPELIAVCDLPRRLPKRRGRAVALKTIHRWIREGVGGRKLKAVKLGGHWFVAPESLEAFIGGLNHESVSAQQRKEMIRLESECDELGI